MAQTKPTLLLLHGAFTGPAAFDKLAPYLEQAKYPIIRADYLSTNPERPAEITVQKDIEHVRYKYLLPLIEREHREVVLVVHSYGGTVGGGAALGLSKADCKAQNLAGGVLGFISISGNIVRENQTHIESAGGQWPPWLVKDKPRPYVAVIEPLVETIAHDAHASLHAEINRDMQPQAYLCFETKSTAPCWTEKGYAGRLAYIRTAEDRLQPVFAQDHWVESTGVQWLVVTMNTSHSPHLTQPQQLSEHIQMFVAKFNEL